MRRLFFGLELPASIRDELAGLDLPVKGVRKVAAPQIHLTMSFLGDVGPEAEERLRTAVAAVRLPGAFFLPVTGVGVFGGERPSVVWAGVGKAHPHLFALHKHLQDAVLQAGLEPDLKPFLRAYEGTEFGLWKVSDVVLYSSVLAPEGSTYTVELRRELA